MLMPLDIITFNNRVTQSGPLAVDPSFQFTDVRDLGKIDLLLINVKEVTDFQMIFLSHNDFLSRYAVPSMNSLL